jgi:hypothetical protein
MDSMKRIVGVSLIVLAFALCPIWVTAIPESEPEIGAVSLIAILYLIAIGLVLSSSSSDTGR